MLALIQSRTTSSSATMATTFSLTTTKKCQSTRTSASPLSTRARRKPHRPAADGGYTVTNEELEAHFQAIGWRIETVVGQDNLPYIVIRDYMIPSGSFAGRTCDVAIQRSSSVPYQAPAA